MQRPIPFSSRALQSCSSRFSNTIGHGWCFKGQMHKPILNGTHRMRFSNYQQLAHGVRNQAETAGDSDIDGPSSSVPTTSGWLENFGGGLEEEFSSFRESRRIPTQGESLVKGIEPGQGVGLADKPPDVDFLQELIAMQQNGPKSIGFFGTRNMGFMHQNLIEVLSYAMVLTGNHIFTSGATGTNAAVIRGAIRAENLELLTVVLPQSLDRQPPDSQELLQNVKKENLIEMPQNNGLTLGQASRICNRDIMNTVQQVICFAFHDSKFLLETCREASENRKMVTLFYLD